MESQLIILHQKKESLIIQGEGGGQGRGTDYFSDRI